MFLIVRDWRFLGGYIKLSIWLFVLWGFFVFDFWILFDFFEREVVVEFWFVKECRYIVSYCNKYLCNNIF